MSFFKLITIPRRIREGFIVPRWYGVAYVDYPRMETVCYPIPLNIIIAKVRNFLVWVKFDCYSKFVSIDDLRAEVSHAHSEGYKQGLFDANQKRS